MIGFVADFLQDARYALRTLQKHPAFAITAIVTLALGVGCVTAMFSIVNVVLLRPLPYRDADRLMMVWETVNLPAYKNAENTPAPGNFRDWRAQSSTFVDLAAFRSRSWSLTGTGEPIRVSGETATASLFTVLQVDPMLGRIFSRTEDEAAQSHVVLLGYGLWRDRFGGSATAVGQTIYLDAEPYTVIGVMPREFRFPNADDQLWVPLGLTANQLTNHGSHFLRVLGRLRPGVTQAQAQSDLDAIAARLRSEFPITNTGVGATVTSLREHTVGDVRRPLLVLLGAVGLLLVMVCANIGGLLLAQASTREREFAVRAALGATRRRLARQLIAESVLVSVFGGGLGLACAVAAVAVLRLAAPVNLPRVEELGVNGVVAAFNFAVALAAGVVCAAAPWWQSRRQDLRAGLSDEARGTSTPAKIGARNLLVVLETGLAVVVMVGAALLLRSFVQLSTVPVGFKSDDRLAFRVVPPPARYTSGEQRTAFYRALIERLQSLPGVRSAGAISFLPLTMQGRTAGLSVEGDSPTAPVRFADFRSVSPGYFSTMSIPFIAGRDVAWSDTQHTALVVVVSETLARAFWPNQNPLGKRIKLGRVGDDAPFLSVVGVVGDVHQLDLVRTPRPAMYFAASQDAGTGDTLQDWILDTAGNATSLAGAVRRAVWGLDSTLPITRLQTMDDIRSAATASQRFNLQLIAFFALFGLALAGVGVYGVTAYSVSQRTRELGIRVALGASPDELLQLVVRHGVTLAAAGLVLGMSFAALMTSVMSSLLFGISARDPLAFAASGLLLLIVSSVASLVPARRAVRIEAAVALRS